MITLIILEITCWLQSKQDGKFGAINLRGEIVVPCKYILEEAMISVPISNKVYRQKQEEMKNAKGNGDFDDLLDKIAECSREVNEKIIILEQKL